MARKLSRRDLAKYASHQLAEGVSLETVARHLAAYLIESRRTNELNIIVRDVADELTATGRVAGTVTSAHQLSSATLKEIEQFVQAKTGAAHLSLDPIVDESVLGGIKLELPGLEMDTTIARTLTILKTRYKKA